MGFGEQQKVFDKYNADLLLRFRSHIFSSHNVAAVLC